MNNKNDNILLPISGKNNGVSKNSVIKLFLLIFIPFVALVTLVFYGIIAIDTKFEFLTLKERELAQAQIAGHLLEFENQQPVTQIKFTANSFTMHRYLSSKSSAEKNRLNYLFSNLIGERQNYDHIILLDNIGNEITRVDRVNGIPVVKENLTNESEKDYFRNTMQLSKDQIYISPLIIDQNAIQNPAFINLGAPVFDENNNKRGVIIFRLNTQKILNGFRTAMQGNGQAALLINDQGKWINKDAYIAPQDTTKYPDFAYLYPAIWDQIKNKENGNVETKLGLFTFSTIYPLLSSNENPIHAFYESNNGIKGKDYFWKIVTFIPAADLPHSSLLRSPPVVGIYLLTLLILGGLIAYLTKMIINKKVINAEFHRYAEQINDLYENAPIGYHSLDGTGKIVHINATELKWLGYTRDEIINKIHITDFMTPTGLRLFYEVFPKFKEKGFIQDIEFEFKRKNGSKFIGLINATAIYDENYEYLMSRTSMVDITKRKQIEYALRESDERFRNAMEHAPIGMAIISPEGRFSRVNGTLAKYLGYNSDELGQFNIDDITSPEDIHIDKQQFSDMKLGKISHYKIEKRLIHKNNEYIWVQLTYSVVNDSSQQPLYFVAQIEDISERKAHQESINHLAYHDTLTNLPNRRLFQEALDEAIEDAKNSNYSLGVIYVDLDNFKTINATLGHQIGDELLKVIADRLSGEVRGNDMVSRTGGDEFVILLAKIASEKDAELIANCIVNVVRAPIFIQEHKLKMTVSIGISIFPRDGNSPKALMRSADLAMYAAKNSGKDQYYTTTDNQFANSDE